MADHKPSSSETDLVISAHKATDTAAQNLTGQSLKVSGIGKGEVISASTWDEFPNGRFGDFHSPAYGVRDPWGGSASHPVCQCLNHITLIFQYFLRTGFVDERGRCEVGQTDHA